MRCPTVRQPHLHKRRKGGEETHACDKTTQSQSGEAFLAERELLALHRGHNQFLEHTLKCAIFLERLPVAPISTPAQARKTKGNERRTELTRSSIPTQSVNPRKLIASYRACSAGAISSGSFLGVRGGLAGVPITVSASSSRGPWDCRPR